MPFEIIIKQLFSRTILEDVNQTEGDVFGKKRWAGNSGLLQCHFMKKNDIISSPNLNPPILASLGYI